MRAARWWTTVAALVCLAGVGVPAARSHWDAGASARQESTVIEDLRADPQPGRARLALLNAQDPVTTTLAALEQAAADQGAQVSTWDSVDTSTPGSPLTSQTWTVTLTSPVGGDMTQFSAEQLVAALQGAPVALDVADITMRPGEVTFTAVLTHVS